MTGRHRGRHVRQNNVELAEVCRQWLASRRAAWRKWRARTEAGGTGE